MNLVIIIVNFILLPKSIFMIPRALENVINEKIGSGKAIIVLGSRQTGKTTLIKKIATEPGTYCFLNCDNPVTKSQLENANTEQLRSIIGNHKVVFVDEAQRVKNIGLTLKLITDEMPEIQLFVTGSSSLEIANQVNEPLTGRKWEYMLYPVSWKELSDYSNYLEARMQLENRLIFGMYPEVIMHKGNETEILLQLSESYLYKDLLQYQGIRKPEILGKILQALALQVSSEVSFNELSNLLQIDKNTVSNYIDLLEKAFIIFRLTPLKRNLRNEINSGRKIYFFDNGIRNSLIANHNPLALRIDAGALWENFLVSERRKYLHYNRILANTFFWRTHAQQEIDYLEERNGKIYAYEFKWNPRKVGKPPKTFLNAYPNAEFQTITPENLNSFLF
jgi:uncharacterized protein